MNEKASGTPPVLANTAEPEDTRARTILFDDAQTASEASTPSTVATIAAAKDSWMLFMNDLR